VIVIGDELHIQCSVHLPSLTRAGELLHHMQHAVLLSTEFSAEAVTVRKATRTSDAEWAIRSREIDDLLNSLE